MGGNASSTDQVEAPKKCADNGENQAVGDAAAAGRAEASLSTEQANRCIAKMDETKGPGSESQPSLVSRYLGKLANAVGWGDQTNQHANAGSEGGDGQGSKERGKGREITKDSSSESQKKAPADDRTSTGKEQTERQQSKGENGSLKDGGLNPEQKESIKRFTDSKAFQAAIDGASEEDKLDAEAAVHMAASGNPEALAKFMGARANYRNDDMAEAARKNGTQHTAPDAVAQLENDPVQKAVQGYYRSIGMNAEVNYGALKDGSVTSSLQVSFKNDKGRPETSSFNVSKGQSGDVELRVIGRDKEGGLVHSDSSAEDKAQVGQKVAEATQKSIKQANEKAPPLPPEKKDSEPGRKDEPDKEIIKDLNKKQIEEVFKGYGENFQRIERFGRDGQDKFPGLPEGAAVYTAEGNPNKGQEVRQFYAMTEGQNGDKSFHRFDSAGVLRDVKHVDSKGETKGTEHFSRTASGEPSYWNEKPGEKANYSTMSEAILKGQMPAETLNNVLNTEGFAGLSPDERQTMKLAEAGSAAFQDFAASELGKSEKAQAAAAALAVGDLSKVAGMAQNEFKSLLATALKESGGDHNTIGLVDESLKNNKFFKGLQSFGNQVGIPVEANAWNAGASGSSYNLALNVGGNELHTTKDAGADRMVQNMLAGLPPEHGANKETSPLGVDVRKNVNGSIDLVDRHKPKIDSETTRSFQKSIGEKFSEYSAPDQTMKTAVDKLEGEKLPGKDTERKSDLVDQVNARQQDKLEGVNREETKIPGVNDGTGRAQVLEDEDVLPGVNDGSGRTQVLDPEGEAVYDPQERNALASQLAVDYVLSDVKGSDQYREQVNSAIQSLVSGDIDSLNKALNADPSLAGHLLGFAESKRMGNNVHPSKNDIYTVVRIGNGKEGLAVTKSLNGSLKVLALKDGSISADPDVVGGVAHRMFWGPKMKR